MKNTENLLEQIELGNLPDTVWMDNHTVANSDGDGDDSDDVGIASCSSDTCRAEDSSKVVAADHALETENLSLNKLLSKKVAELA
ncbi:MAG TPA: hypothetical protein DCE41_18930 [Cytophagales bacterium]|nr:hypothetical protein [Cytophagales bacterium]HAA22115.1 hypothetical protein [Cytophagales bacterium]HAP60829.1 hypothetical protein [Cytophagales bacterium]